jgi:hypothetical protein
MNTDLSRLFDSDVYSMFNSRIVFRDEQIKQLEMKLEASNKRVAELEIILLEIEQKIQNALPVSNM